MQSLKTLIYGVNGCFLPTLPKTAAPHQIPIGCPCNIIGHFSSQIPWAHIFLLLSMVSKWSLNNSFSFIVPAGISACWADYHGHSLGVHTENLIIFFLEAT